MRRVWIQTGGRRIHCLMKSEKYAPRPDKIYLNTSERCGCSVAGPTCLYSRGQVRHKSSRQRALPGLPRMYLHMYIYIYMYTYIHTRKNMASLGLLRTRPWALEGSPWAYVGPPWALVGTPWAREAPTCPTVAPRPRVQG